MRADACVWQRLLKLLKDATTLIGDRGHADVGVAKVHVLERKATRYLMGVSECLARAMASEAKHLCKRRTGSADAGSPLLIIVAKGCLHCMVRRRTIGGS